MSFPSILIVLSSFLWLSYRAIRIWSIPLTLVLRHLHIEIPSAPKLTIDALGAETVSLHWSPPESHVKKHIIQMDGQEVGISVRGETSVTISGLTADYLYSIQVIAVNAQGFQVSSQIVYVRTRQPDIEAIEQRDVQNTDKVDTTLEALRKEEMEIDQQAIQLAKQYKDDEIAYTTKLETLRTKKKEEDETRVAKDVRLKQMEHQKREVETKRNQVQKLLKAEQDEYRRQSTDITSYRSSIQNSIETAEHLEESLITMETETNDAIKEAERTGAIAAEELSEIESEIRYLLSRKAESELESTRLLSESRVPSPTPQEKAEEQQEGLIWQEREDFLAKQLEDVQNNLLRLQNMSYADFTPTDQETSLRRRVSRHGRPERPESRSTALSFNPDAAPFVATTIGFPDSPIKTSFPETYATTSIFNDNPVPRNPSPFIRRTDSPLSSHSGSTPASPAAQGRIQSIFNSVPNQRVANSLVSSLNGTPLLETEEVEEKKWSWKKKSTNADPLALDRKNTRSLPKSDVAPIGTRRRSGSLREEHPPMRPAPPLNAYQDLDVVSVVNGISGHHLPSPSDGGAFGWTPRAVMPQRVGNPWDALPGIIEPRTEERPSIARKDHKFGSFVSRVFGKKDSDVDD